MLADVGLLANSLHHGLENSGEKLGKFQENVEGKSAGSGSIVSTEPFSAFPLDISNPRVLSDMGLAIPRPTRFPPALAGLGDPRNSIKSLVSCIRLSLLIPNGSGKLLGLLQRGCNSAAAALRLSSSSNLSFFLSLQRMYRCCAFVNSLEPFKNCCSVGLRKKEGHHSLRL